ncbi:tubulin-specific chaperone a, putative [Hepatocystis sp. ex Piliocolobus tephrosceles]|nr:tubulin-specific chaperone a, putative [Hepatocystis sp. ex Piliocolobus tephrosceles]
MEENFANNFKQLKINHGAVKRLFKELSYYEKEEVELRNKLNNLKEENKSENEITRAEEIWKETTRVIPHINNSLQNTLKKLFEIIKVNFLNILEIDQKKINICKNISEEELKEKCSTQYENFCKEIDELNKTLENVSICIKDISIFSCSSPVVKNNIVMPKEECVDI